MSKKEYSALAVAIDLVMNEYNTFNPIEISELIYEDLGICTTVDQISNYLEVNNIKQQKIFYKSLSNN